MLFGSFWAYSKYKKSHFRAFKNPRFEVMQALKVRNVPNLAHFVL